MKITVSKDFGTAETPVLPLVPEPTTVNKKEDLAESCGFPTVALAYPCLSLVGGLQRDQLIFLHSG